MLSSEVGTNKSAYCRKEITAFAQKQKCHHVGTTFVYVVHPPVKIDSQDNSSKIGRTPKWHYIRRLLLLIGSGAFAALLPTVQLGGYRDVKPVPGEHAPMATKSTRASQQYKDAPSALQVLTTTPEDTQPPPNRLCWSPGKKCSTYHLLLRSAPLKLKELPMVNITIEFGACLELYTDEKDNIYAFRAFFEPPSKHEFEIYQ